MKTIFYYLFKSLKQEGAASGFIANGFIFLKSDLKLKTSALNCTNKHQYLNVAYVESVAFCMMGTA